MVNKKKRRKILKIKGLNKLYDDYDKNDNQYYRNRTLRKVIGTNCNSMTNVEASKPILDSNKFYYNSAIRTRQQSVISAKITNIKNSNSYNKFNDKKQWIINKKYKFYKRINTMEKFTIGPNPQFNNVSFKPFFHLKTYFLKCNQSKSIKKANISMRIENNTDFSIEELKKKLSLTNLVLQTQANQKRHKIICNNDVKKVYMNNKLFNITNTFYHR